MKKLLGLMICVCAGIVLTMGTTGCTNKDKDKDKTKKEAAAKDKDATTKDKDGKPKDKDAASKDKDAMPKDKDAMPKDKDAMPKDKDAMPKDKDAAPKDKDAVSKDKDMKLEIAEGKAVTLKQGGKETAKADVKLGKDVKEAKVTVEISKGPKDFKGVTATAGDGKLSASGNATAIITATDDATPGDYTVTITVTAEGATPASTKVGVTVAKK